MRVDCIFTSKNMLFITLYNKYLFTKGTLYHKGLSYLIQLITKFEYILCSVNEVMFYIINALSY